MLQRRALQLLVQLQQCRPGSGCLAQYSSTILQPPAPDWEVDYKVFVQQLKAHNGQHKHYPAPEAKRASKGDDAQADLQLAPTTTKADETGVTATMKRQLYHKLVLLIKAPSPVSRAGSGSAAGSSSPVWGFPVAEHQPGESMRATAERALKEAIGPAQVFFIGNAPMAHLPLGAGSASDSNSSSSSSEANNPATNSSGAAARTQQAVVASSVTSSEGGPESRQQVAESPAVYFHLAQVLNDPWDVQLQQDQAEDHAWVSLEELPQYISDPHLLDLARKWW